MLFSTIYICPHFLYKNLLFYITNILLTFLKLQKHSVLLIYEIFYLNKRKIIFFNIKILKLSSKFCKNQFVKFLHFSFVITKLYTISTIYTIFYYLHYFLLFSKFTYYFVWRNLPTNSNYFTKIYLLFSVSLMIIIVFVHFCVVSISCLYE